MRAGSTIAGAFLALFVSTGSLFSFPVFFAPLGDKFHAPLQALSGPQSLALCLYFIFGAIGGLLASRRGPRDIVVLGALLTTIGFTYAPRPKRFFRFSSVSHSWLASASGFPSFQLSQWCYDAFHPLTADCSSD